MIIYWLSVLWETLDVYIFTIIGCISIMAYIYVTHLLLCFTFRNVRWNNNNYFFTFIKCVPQSRTKIKIEIKRDVSWNFGSIGTGKPGYFNFQLLQCWDIYGQTYLCVEKLIVAYSSFNRIASKPHMKRYYKTEYLWYVN